MPRCPTSLPRRSRYALLAAALAGCTPYAVHNTARPLYPGERSVRTIVTIVPGGAELRSSGGSTERSAAVPTLDSELRNGLDDRSDIGMRLNAGSGLIVSWKRRLDGRTIDAGAATAVLLGAGIVNLGNHAHFEATLIHSAQERRTVVPYGGLRAIQVAPMSVGAVHDRPTLGGFAGARLETLLDGANFELGVFYDRSALGMRRGDLVIVPSLSFARSPFRR